MTMRIAEDEHGDAEMLGQLSQAESQALRGDCDRAASLLALERGEADDFAEPLGRSRRSVRMPRGGIDAVQIAKRKGTALKLPRHHEDAVWARLDSGTRPDDWVRTFRAIEVVRTYREESAVRHMPRRIRGVVHTQTPV